ncbi:hypothetical protein D0T60_15635 [Bacteroides sp. 224]|nr:hypothetical protein [Bacteroides sp. 224]
MKLPQLTERGENYLRKQKRYGKWFDSEETTIEYFLNQQIDIPDVFLDLQLQYSGYEFSCHRKHNFSFFLISKGQIAGNKPLQLTRANNERLLEINEGYATAQFTFYVNSQGEICTYGCETNSTIVPLYSSIDVLIEECAYKDLLYRREIADFSHHHVADKTKLCKYLSAQYKKVMPCSDKYATWFENNQISIQIAPWYGGEGYYLCTYCTDRNIIDTLINQLYGLELLVNNF